MSCASLVVKATGKWCCVESSSSLSGFPLQHQVFGYNSAEAKISMSVSVYPMCFSTWKKEIIFFLFKQLLLEQYVLLAYLFLPFLSHIPLLFSHVYGFMWLGWSGCTVYQLSSMSSYKSCLLITVLWILTLVAFHCCLTTPCSFTSLLNWRDGKRGKKFCERLCLPE